MSHGDAVSSTSRRNRWLAIASLASVLVAAIVFIAGADGKAVGLALLIVAAVVLVVIGAWLALSHRGLIRIAGVLLAVVSVVGLVVIEARHGALWVVVATVALLACAVVVGRLAMREPVAEAEPETLAARSQHPFLIMNPRSGGGKVERFDLQANAERRGAEVALLDTSHQVDVAAMARDAVDAGADLLGVAGGDGTQALVAGVAAKAHVPLMVIPAGTRNHFALDLGLDRDDPSQSLDALDTGVDLTIDLGDVAGRPFVNNVSFGAYAAIVARPDYRDDKVQVTLNALPDLLGRQRGPRLTVRTDGLYKTWVQAVLVSNNPYGLGDIAGLGRRATIAGGELGVVVVEVASALDAVRLMRGRDQPGLTVTTAREVIIESSTGEVPAGIDGESVLLPSPVRCTIRPGALTVRVPRQRPGVPTRKPAFGLRRLAAVAAGHTNHNGNGNGEPER